MSAYTSRLELCEMGAEFIHMHLYIEITGEGSLFFVALQYSSYHVSLSLQHTYSNIYAHTNNLKQKLLPSSENVMQIYFLINK